jgi:hypothetical protein
MVKRPFFAATRTLNPVGVGGATAMESWDDVTCRLGYCASVARILSMALTVLVPP